MRLRSFARSVGLVALLAASAAGAQTLLPERRSVLADGFDLPGGDLRQIFDTSLDACERACLADRACTAFTYNARNGACFPKAGAGDPAPYARAISGRIVATDPAAETTARSRAGELAFLPRYMVPQATVQAREMGRNHLAGAFDAETLRQAAQEAESAGDPARAARLWGAVANVTAAASDWEDFARLSLIAASPGGNDAPVLRESAVAAAINAYLRAGPAPQRHTILTVMAEALEATGNGRLSVGALRLAQSIQFRDDTARALDRVAGLYGLRIEEHQVDSDLASPRLCATFTEDLVDKGLDYTPFVQLPAPGLTVEPGGWRQLCVAGLTHGQRITVTFREGLPSADGQTLAKSVDITAYVRDRRPAARFAGGGFVLPRTGAAAIPVQTVNAPRLELELFRLSDRSLIRTMQADWFARPMDSWDAGRFSEQVGERLCAKGQGSGGGGMGKPRRLAVVRGVRPWPDHVPGHRRADGGGTVLVRCLGQAGGGGDTAGAVQPRAGHGHNRCRWRGAVRCRVDARHRGRGPCAGDRGRRRGRSGLPVAVGCRI